MGHDKKTSVSVWTFVRVCFTLRSQTPFWRRMCEQIRILQSERQEMRRKAPPGALYIGTIR